jgi:hypothetical protein
MISSPFPHPAKLRSHNERTWPDMGTLHYGEQIPQNAAPQREVYLLVIPPDIAFAANFTYFYCSYGLSSSASMVVRREDAPLFATMTALITGMFSGAAPPFAKVKTWHMESLWLASPGVRLAEVYSGQAVVPFKYPYRVNMAASASGFHLH